MTDNLIEHEIDRIVEFVGANLINREFIRKDQVIDALLDLRNTTDDSAVLQCIDDALLNAPGLTLSSSDWFLEELSRIRDAVTYEDEEVSCHAEDMG